MSAVAETKTGFVHLHNHSHYSLLDGLSKVPAMLDRVSELGMTAVALTDHGTLSGAIEFYQEAAKRGIKSIIGLEAYMAPRGLDDKTAKVDANPYHLILLAENNIGYKNLMKLVTVAHLEGFYYKPRIDRELLAKHSKGLIALSACAGGEVATHIRNGDLNQAEAVVRWYQQTFGPDHYYLELQDHEEKWPEQRQINEGLIELAQRTGAPLVLTADSHYCLPTDREVHEILLCIQTGKTIGDTDRMTMEMDLFVSDPAEIAKRWEKYPEALANTGKIAEMCRVEIEFGKFRLPVFDVPAGDTQQDYLRRLSFQGLAWRYGGIAKEDISVLTEEKAKQLVKPDIVERLDYELSVISKMGYESYFLIVADFVNWGKNQGIIFGPGRGSASGSILSYVLNITDLDPMAYDLMFERFLNPDRINMPDIDIDIQDNRRQEVIDYVTEKYGQDRVAQIITFGTMAARATVRDTGRALGMAYLDVDRVAKLVPQPVQGRHVPLEKSIKDNPELKQEYNSNPNTKRLIDLAMRLEGTIRNNGVHAAGVVIGPDALVNYTPLQRAQKGGVATQYSMNPLDDIGLLKMDFLGLSNLTTIKNALRIVKKVYGTNIDLATLPLDDKKTLELFARGDTTGVFQFESAGMKRYLRELKPSSFYDIIAMAALYRPGPMQWIEDFVERKHGRKKIEYLHPSMENALKNTYGIIVYQEQVMQISKDMCGFTGGQADTLRKAIGKKKPKELAKMKTDFIEGAIKTVGANRDLMETFWGNLEAFAAYCFPKAHAASYALIAYQTAYLKAHYPAAFMAALMTTDQDNIERIAIEVAECQRMGIEVLPPSVNESYLEFGVMASTGSIRFGLGAIKNLGGGPVETLIAAREVGGQFKSVEDFARRVNATHVNRKAWESLIKAGAMDDLADRGESLFNLDLITSYASKYQKNALSGQIDIFGSLGVEDQSPKLLLAPAPTELSNPEKLAWEKEHLGLYLSHHPLDDFQNYLAGNTQPIGGLKTMSEGQSVKVGGVITTVKKIVTRNNAMMAFCGIADKTGEVELIVFPKTFEAYKDLWELDKIVAVTGKVSFKSRDGQVGEEVKLMADQVSVITPEQAGAAPPAPVPKIPVVNEEVAEVVPAGRLTIQVPDLADAASLVNLKKVLGRHPGVSETFIILTGSESKKIKLPFRVAASKQLVTELAELFGREHISLDA